MTSMKPRNAMLASAVVLAVIGFGLLLQAPGGADAAGEWACPMDSIAREIGSMMDGGGARSAMGARQEWLPLLASDGGIEIGQLEGALANRTGPDRLEGERLVIGDKTFAVFGVPTLLSDGTWAVGAVSHCMVSPASNDEPGVTPSDVAS